MEKTEVGKGGLWCLRPNVDVRKHVRPFRLQKPSPYASHSYSSSAAAPVMKTLKLSCQKTNFLAENSANKSNVVSNIRPNPHQSNLCPSPVIQSEQFSVGQARNTETSHLEKSFTNHAMTSQRKSQVSDCKNCKNCLDKKVYGGPGRIKRPCLNKVNNTQPQKQLGYTTQNAGYQYATDQRSVKLKETPDFQQYSFEVQYPNTQDNSSTEIPFPLDPNSVPIQGEEVVIENNGHYPNFSIQDEVVIGSSEPSSMPTFDSMTNLAQ